MPDARCPMPDARINDENNSLLENIIHKYIISTYFQYFILMIVKGNMLVCLVRRDWMLVSILTFIIWRTTPAEYVPALKRTRKRTKRKDQGDNNKFVEESAYGVGAGFDNF